jgi:hypothetical protein
LEVLPVSQRVRDEGCFVEDRGRDADVSLGVDALDGRVGTEKCSERHRCRGGFSLCAEHFGSVAFGFDASLREGDVADVSGLQAHPVGGDEAFERREGLSANAQLELGGEGVDERGRSSAAELSKGVFELRFGDA